MVYLNCYLPYMVTLDVCNCVHIVTVVWKRSLKHPDHHYITIQYLQYNVLQYSTYNTMYCSRVSTIQCITVQYLQYNVLQYSIYNTVYNTIQYITVYFKVNVYLKPEEVVQQPKETDIVVVGKLLKINYWLILWL